MSTALGLAISLKHMIKNTESIEGLFESSNTPAQHYLSPLFEIFRNRSVVTNLILSNLMILVIMIGGFKTFIWILIFIAIAIVTGTSGGSGSVDSLDRRMLIFVLVIFACISISALAKLVIYIRVLGIK
ncbi:hypothetical protein NAEGRDRAFT_76376 [Naegleria gruberi]|uniref:Uncharacterized protein n=1 Tax=Naegleria gruberi TaxID=5762 RepID=D2W4P1_NAEGR|nr:uncharacterized protein NAEGRDRAFT_76376 [Naegleria gruberi]EFC35959.1 hypothetical protein NAEGRDRAFT_76376 [Naegleria gruberi]|eukprot:XP_002668703.1 hypothetical protein NAEGRDRAFT_76376 [Naegleria gruberi strain NEG-M]